MLAYLGGRCVGCGSVIDLQFHHIDPDTKSFNPRAKAGMKWETLVPEMDKCELRCEPCHKAKHATSHGTVTMYINHKCRCKICKDAVRLYRGHEEFSPAKHGSRAMYAKGCRCDICRIEQSIYARLYYHRKKQEYACL